MASSIHHSKSSKLSIGVSCDCALAQRKDHGYSTSSAAGRELLSVKESNKSMVRWAEV